MTSRTFMTVLALAGGTIGIVLAVVLLNTIRFRSKQIDPPPQAGISVDKEAPDRLSEALRYRTITKRDPSALDRPAFEALFDYFGTAFPRVHEAMQVTPVNGLSRLYTWRGSTPSLDPVVLMAHVDVVPVAENAEAAWTHPPFAGTKANGYVWGRGALDDKASAVGLLEAAETLLREGVQPRRTVHIALGHDEEVGGANGAQALAEQITADGVNPAFVLDEGGAITDGALPDVAHPVAVIGIAEKGYLTVEIEADGPGGHSSVPPDTTSIEVVAEAVRRLRDNPLPASLEGVTGQTFEYVAPEMSLPVRTAFANQWLTRPLLTWALGRNDVTDAAIRTTTAPTMLDAGVKDNVVPSTARAVVNFRIVPRQSVANVMDHVRSTLHDLPVSFALGQNSEPTPVSDVTGPWFPLIHHTLRQVVSDPLIVAPYLVPGTTDSRYYAPHSDHVYRFAPFRLTPDDRERIHGTDERISLEEYTTMVQFYAQLIRNADAVDS